MFTVKGSKIVYSTGSLLSFKNLNVFSGTIFVHFPIEIKKNDSTPLKKETDQTLMYQWILFIFRTQKKYENWNIVFILCKSSKFEICNILQYQSFLSFKKMNDKLKI